MKKFLDRAKVFIGHDVWVKRETDFSSRKGWWLVRQLRLILYTGRGVQNHNTFLRSSSLAFYTIMSLVPMLALAFGVIKGFGLEKTLENYLFERFAGSEYMIGTAFDFINSVLERTSGGIVAVTGLAVLVWAAVSVFGNVEGAFNAIWEVQSSRSITRRASTYTAVIFLMPLLIVMLTIIFSYVRSLIGNYASIPYNVLYIIGSFLLVWILFSGAYKMIPNTKVKLSCAFKAGLVASVVFFGFQYFYVALQNGVSSYNIIYGSFAAIPLFLFWVQVSWQIVLFGAELSFAYQNVDSFVQEQNAANVSYAGRRKVMLASLLVVIRSFIDREGGVSSETIAKELKLPVRLVRDVNYALVEAKVIVAVASGKSQKTNMYIPAQDVHGMKLCDVLYLVENVGTDVKVPEEPGYMNCVSNVLDGMEERMASSDANMLLTDFLGDEYSFGR